jgi:hypothetical protein
MNRVQYNKGREIHVDPSLPEYCPARLGHASQDEFREIDE